MTNEVRRCYGGLHCGFLAGQLPPDICLLSMQSYGIKVGYGGGGGGGGGTVRPGDPQAAPKSSSCC